MNSGVFIHRRVRSTTDTPFGRPWLDPFQFLSAHHRFQIALCGFLEALSTDLHQARAGEFAAIACRYLEEWLPLHQENEKSHLREALELQPDFGAEESTLFNLVEEGHRRDWRFAVPVLEGLARLALGSFPTNPRAFVIALIQLAESLRRHIDWEERVIIPLAAERLPPDARAALLDRMAGGRDQWDFPACRAFGHSSAKGPAHAGDLLTSRHHPIN